MVQWLLQLSQRSQRRRGRGFLSPRIHSSSVPTRPTASGSTPPDWDKTGITATSSFSTEWVEVLI
ncbi:unnamed protein product [Tuber melanosporum]|uniref:(Perigord truffle) hypothetical protein n=1 Tax=Tuber melanosporum (strain Mel28) TaxID=656061 RepID=D5GGA6_TUBMM|nr:uncharacterized protein GSTUM_00007294001 [Tuber melanosporum]CAZ83549.1 unnamed protein product [Tuber melanosporum]